MADVVRRRANHPGVDQQLVLGKTTCRYAKAAPTIVSLVFLVLGEIKFAPQLVSEPGGI